MDMNQQTPPAGGKGKGMTAIVVIIVIILAALATYVIVKGGDENREAVTPPPSPVVEDGGNTGASAEVPPLTASDGSSPVVGEGGGGNTGSAPASAQVKAFTVSGSNFAFAPAELKVKKGDTVRITFKNTGGFHDLVVDGYGAATKQMQAGNEETIEFVASKAGTFEYYCSVGQHRQMGMRGRLVVE